MMEPIQLDGKELVEAVITEVKRLCPDYRISYIMAMDPGYVLVSDDGIMWFTFHAPYFMKYVNRRSGQFELGDHGRDVVRAMVREMQMIEPEGSMPVEYPDGKSKLA